MYYLILEGLIPEEQRYEFEQTSLLVSNQMPMACIGYWFRKAGDRSTCSFVSCWSSPEASEAFKKTPGYLMLSGAFAALGESFERSEGEMITPFNHSS